MTKYMKSILVVFIVLYFSSSIHAQKPEIDSTLNNRTNSIYFESRALFKCNIRLPVDYNPQKKYLLVLGLHGGGSSFEKFISIWDSLNITDFIYAAPQAPYAWLLDKELGYDWALWPTGNSKLITRASDLIKKYISDLAKYLKEHYSISDVYLFGFSQGAIFTYIAGMKNHNLYKGLIIHSGPGLLEPLLSRFTDESEDNWLEEDYIKSAKKLRIFIAHGRDDKMAKFELGIKSQSVLLNFGYDVTFKDFPGGHSVNNKMLENVLEWLKQ